MRSGRTGRESYGWGGRKEVKCALISLLQLVSKLRASEASVESLTNQVKMWLLLIVFTGKKVW